MAPYTHTDAADVANRFKWLVYRIFWAPNHFLRYTYKYNAFACGYFHLRILAKFLFFHENAIIIMAIWIQNRSMRLKSMSKICLFRAKEMKARDKMLKICRPNTFELSQKQKLRSNKLLFGYRQNTSLTLTMLHLFLLNQK